MSLPMARGGQPPRPPTHQPLELRRLTALASDLEDAMEAGGHASLNAEIIDEVSVDLGAPASHFYAAAAVMTELAFDQAAPVKFHVCVGGCQSFGALPALEKLIELRADRVSAGQPVFDLVARKCLDKCERGAVIVVHTPDGTAGISEATPESVEEAVGQAMA